MRRIILTDKEIKRFHSKEPVRYSTALRLREQGVKQGLFTERALERWKCEHSEDKV